MTLDNFMMGERKGWQQSATKGYLKLLQEWGYELADVEKDVTK